jgi:hypothetical protein
VLLIDWSPSRQTAMKSSMSSFVMSAICFSPKKGATCTRSSGPPRGVQPRGRLHPHTSEPPIGCGRRGGPDEAPRPSAWRSIAWTSSSRRGVSGFVGPNGAGKTTTIRMLLGLVRPGGGTARVLGQPISDPAAYLPRVGALIEAPAFYPTLSGRRNLEVLAPPGATQSLPDRPGSRPRRLVGSRRGPRALLVAADEAALGCGRRLASRAMRTP